MNRKVTMVAMAVAWVALTVFSGAAHAVKGPQGVASTVHNLAYNSPNPNNGYRVTNEDEVCIFCHTPHGGSLDAPLWNRTTNDGFVNLEAAAYFTHYNSATLSPYLQGLAQNRPIGVESLVCMTCHDGTIATNRVINVSNRTTPGTYDPAHVIESATGQPENWIIPDTWNQKPMAMIGASPTSLGIDPYDGGNLEDDHPISFDYDQAQQSKGASALVAIDTVKTKGIRFFPQNASNSGTRMECSSCHDPHVNYGQISGQPGYGNSAYTQYTPFLVTTNNASAMCLTCHIK